MKNLILILSVAISLSILGACDNEGIEPPDDSIVGKYNLIKSKINGTDRTSDCTTQSSWSFLSDNSIVTTFYKPTPNGCSSISLVGSWSKSSSKYFIILDGDPIFSEFNNDVLTIRFTVNNILFDIDYKKE